MRILLSWARRPSDPDIGILINRLANDDHKLVYFIGAPFDERLARGALFHSYLDAENALPSAEIDVFEFEPLDEDLIKKMYHTESIVLTMMNRLFDRLCVDERRRIYYEMLRYWFGVLKRYAPDVIIFPNMPHLVYDYIIYEVAHFLGIKTIAFDDTRFPGRLLMFTDFERLTGVLKKELKNTEGRMVSVNELSEDIRNYYEPRSHRDFSATPSYIVEQKRKYAFRFDGLSAEKVKESIRDFSFLGKIPRYILWLVTVKGPQLLKRMYTHVSYPLVPDLRKEYSRLQTAPGFSKKFVYFPLQMQPEKTTSPQGDMFVDQILALEILSASVPQDYVIYVKEHPLQWIHFGIRFSSFRYAGYYRRIARIKNVRLVPVAESSYRLMNEAQAVSAVTGSAGFEAVLRSKPAVIFGTVWYEDCPGIFKVGNTESCRAAFSRIASGFEVKQQAIITYLKCFDAVTIRAFISALAGKASNVSKEECMRNITSAIIHALSS